MSHRPLAHPLWAACRAGREPAEALPTRLRAQLLVVLVRSGLSVAEVGHRTRMSEYTVRRILTERGGVC